MILCIYSGEGVLLWDPSGEANERFDQILFTDQLNVAIIENHLELRKENLIFHHDKTRLQVSSETRKKIVVWEDFTYLPYSTDIESFIYFVNEKYVVLEDCKKKSQQQLAGQKDKKNFWDEIMNDGRRGNKMINILLKVNV